MKTIQSFWSKPSFHDNQDYINSRKFGGWLNYKYFLISTALSCLTLKRHQKSVDLYTDSFGYDLYVKKLNLPYDDVKLSLDILENEDHRLWILGKLIAIKDQTQPFIHIDNDVYLWNSIPINNNRLFLIAQSESKIPWEYVNTLNEIQNKFDNVPICLKIWPTIANVGIIGGNNVDFFQSLCEISASFLKENRYSLNNFYNIGYLNQILEEYLFVCLARYRKIPIKYLLKFSKYKNPVDEVTQFNLVPVAKKYIHLIGSSKQSFSNCEQLEIRLKYEFPTYYKYILSMFESTYPTLISTTQHKQRIRIDTLTKEIAHLYTNSRSSILNIKFRLLHSVEILTEISKSSKDDEIYYIIYNDPFSDIKMRRELTGDETLLIFFENSISINELIEELKIESGNLGKRKLENLENKLIGVVTKASFVDLILNVIDA